MKKNDSMVFSKMMQINLPGAGTTAFGQYDFRFPLANEMRLVSLITRSHFVNNDTGVESPIDNGILEFSDPDFPQELMPVTIDVNFLNTIDVTNSRGILLPSNCLQKFELPDPGILVYPNRDYKLSANYPAVTVAAGGDVYFQFIFELREKI